MEYIKKLLQALLDTLVPPGTIIMYGGSQVPDGYILIQNVKVYEDEFPRLYPILAACSELEKGNDSGRAWVKMPNPDGRVPQFTTSGSLVWKLLEAALPDIRGEFPAALIRNGAQGSTAWGAIIQNRAYAATVALGDGFWASELDFDASYDNQIYTGTTTQPAALQVLPCIRI